MKLNTGESPSPNFTVERKKKYIRNKKWKNLAEFTTAAAAKTTKY